MLFDLQGKRRRVVQATYLTLAVLMGGGLVFFGIGGDVSGGLFDAFKGGGGGGGGNELIEKRVEKNEKRLAQNPRSEATLKVLVRDYFQLAGSKTPSESPTFSDDAKGDLRKAAEYWQRYLKVAEKPGDPPAGYALQALGQGGLNKPKEAMEAARVYAQAQNDANAYIELVKYATLAGDKRLADLAGQKAIELAPKSQRAAAKASVEAAKQPQQPAQPQGG
jgi:hypothetical protein